VQPRRPGNIGGKDYSVYEPGKVRLGLRLWTEAFLRALPQQMPAPPDEADD